MNYDPSRAWVSETLKHDSTVTCCRFSRCGKFVVAGDVDGKLRQWELASGETRSANGHPSWLASIAVTKDRMYSADLQGTVICRPFPLEEGKPAWSVKDAHRPFLRAMGLSPDGKTLATAGDDKLVRLWDAKSGKAIRELAGHPAYVCSLAIHPKGRFLVSGDLLGNVKQWDLESGKCVRDLDARVLHSRKENFLADVGGVRAMAFDREGKKLACSGLREAKSNTFSPGKPTVLVFDWGAGKLHPVMGASGVKVDGYVNTVRFLKDGSLAGADETHGGHAYVYFWKPGATEQFHHVGIRSGYDMDVHPDGLRLAVASFQARGRGGNGRHVKRGEYVAHAGAVRLISLFPKPPKKKK